MQFGDILKDLRKSADLTQEEFGKLIGVSRSTVGMYEQGKREPDFETMEKIADYFNVSLDYLQTGKHSKFHLSDVTDLFYGKSFYVDSIPQTDTERRLVLEFRKADKTTQDIIMRILEKR